MRIKDTITQDELNCVEVQQLLFIICNPTPTMPSVLEVYWGSRGGKP